MLSNAFAQPNWGNISPVLLSPVVLEGEQLGEVWIRPSHGESSLLVDREGFINSITTIVNDSYLNKLKTLNLDKAYFSQADVQAAGLSIVFDPNDLSVFLAVPLSARKRRELNLGIAPRVSETLFFSSDVSTYLNVNLRHDYSQTSASRNKAYLDWFGQYKEWVLNHASSYNEFNNNELSRTHTRLIKESAKTMEVFTAGDLRYTTAGFQTFREGAGISFSREFSLQPYNITRSIEPYTLILKKASIVEIYVNGALVHKGFQPAGRLDLLNYPVVTGENEVLVRVEEPSGRIERFVFNRFHHGNLLAPGISEFSYNVFQESFSDDGSIDYEPEISTNMFYRYGVDTRLTFGANFASDNDGLMAGVESKNLIHKAFLESNVAFGQNDDGSGLAAGLNLISVPKWKNELSPYNYQLSANLWQKDFYNPGSGKSNRKFKASGRVIKDLTPYLGASLGLENEVFFEEDEINSYSTTLQYRVTSQLRLTLNYKKAFGHEGDESYFFTFNWFEKTGKTQVYGAYYEDTKNSQVRGTHRFIEG
ncbi:MAG: fimbria/pilus outer membrane usher protein, partial [Bacteriovoracaceae bacterium]|nr:fimbria/pilus outer membrane usher protein [Bacteriovoracaceae bacterium]